MMYNAKHAWHLCLSAFHLIAVRGYFTRSISQACEIHAELCMGTWGVFEAAMWCHGMQRSRTM